MLKNDKNFGSKTGNYRISKWDHKNNNGRRRAQNRDALRRVTQEKGE